MAKKLRCTVTPSDFVRVSDWQGDSDIALQVKVGEKTEDIFLTFADAKKLRKQIKSALAEIEWDEEPVKDQDEEEPVYIPHVGEVVEVYRNTTEHGFSVGERVRVVQIEESGKIWAEHIDGSDFWRVSGDIRPIQNWKPKEGEKVLIVDSTFVPSPVSKSFVGNFGYIMGFGNAVLVYNEDKSDWFGFHASDLRPAE